MSSERRVTSSDYHLIRERIAAAIEAADHKSWLRSVDLDIAMDYLFNAEHVYIVDDCYLVAFELGSPWYSTDLFLNEVIVCALAVGGDFGAVCAFFERKAREAGCRWSVAGTALARKDRALASLYRKHGGYEVECLQLTKEINGLRIR